MRILNVTQSYFPFLEFGGPPVKVRALSRALVRRGHRVSVLTADWGIERRVSAEPAVFGGTPAERRRFGWRWEEQGVEAIYLASSARYRALTWNRDVRRFCRERLREFDVVHIFGLYDLLGAGVAGECRRAGVPYVVEPIGMFLPIVRNFWLKRMYHLLLGKRMLNGCRFLVATSEQEARELITGGVAAEKIVLRRNGVDVPEKVPERGSFRRTLGISDEARVVLFLGRLSEKKNPDLLVEAFATVCKQDKTQAAGSLCLAFVGPDEEQVRKKLARRVEELGMTARVHFCGALFGAEKWSAYRDADVFVLPSENENFGNTAAEAAAAGTPVIVSEKCGIAPLLANVAGIVVPLDIASLAQAIRRILFKPELHARLTAGCREVARRLDWGEPAGEMERLYGRVAVREELTTECARV